MKQVPYSEHKILELPVNLTPVVLLNVHELIIIFFTQKTAIIMLMTLGSPYKM